MDRPSTSLPSASGEHACCAEFRTVSRRGLLSGVLAAGTVAGLASTFGSTVVQAAAAAPGTKARGVVVVVSLRGAADGLSLVVPHGDPVYAKARPRLAVPTERLLARNDFYGLHPALEPLMKLWDAGRVGVVHAAGLPARNRSHFAAMEELENASPGSRTRSGWLNRLVGADRNPSPLQALQLGGTPPASLYGNQPFLSASSVSDVAFAGADGNPGRTKSLRTLWGNAPGQLGASMRSAFTAVQQFEPAKKSSEKPQHGVTYPDSDLGRALGEVARVVRSDVGVEVVTVDHGDWDMHTDVGNLEWGAMKREAGSLASALAAFFADLGDLGEQVTVVCLSEFGRRVEENASWGLDHGYGTVMMLLGAGVRGGYHGRWPGLSRGADADLLVTTDYRSVLAEVVRARFNASTAAVFPGFTPQRVGAMVGQ